MAGGFPSQSATNTENISIWWRHHEYTKANANVNKIRQYMKSLSALLTLCVGIQRWPDKGPVMRSFVVSLNILLIELSSEFIANVYRNSLICYFFLPCVLNTMLLSRHAQALASLVCFVPRRRVALLFCPLKRPRDAWLELKWRGTCTSATTRNSLTIWSSYDRLRFIMGIITPIRRCLFLWIEVQYVWENINNSGSLLWFVVFLLCCIQWTSK